jgi:two-component system, NtrC family, response regulator GlrR
MHLAEPLFLRSPLWHTSPSMTSSTTGTRPMSAEYAKLPTTIRLVARADGLTLARHEFSRGRLVIGSAEGNDIVLKHETVSRKHVELHADGETLYVKDLQSKNGTRLAGSRIGEAFLSVGHVLVLGGVELRIENGDEPEAAKLGQLEAVSKSMRSAIEALRKVAPSEATLLLEAETGSGKDVTARAIHLASPRAEKPFETLDCSALPKDLAAAQLFGHVKGAFTSADKDRAGAFERANGGTLFLDEIGELPLELQPLLLRALESREVRRVGDEKTVKVDVRVIAATNRDLDAEVAAGRFRKDLLHRLAVVRVRIPPLRERLEDLPILVRTILDQLGPRARGFTLSPTALKRLGEHHWPGNVRELRNFIERALALGTAMPGETLTDEADQEPESGPTIDYKVAREEALASFEKEFVTHLLRVFDGNVSRASREAGLDRAYLHRLIKKHGVEAK